MNGLTFITSAFELARLNYPIQTEAIKQTTGSLKEKQRGGAYASEADLINMLVFDMTAKQWRASNPDAKGNIRDSASTVQNTMLPFSKDFRIFGVSQLMEQSNQKRAAYLLHSFTCSAGWLKN